MNDTPTDTESDTPVMAPLDLAMRVRTLRLEAGVTQAELARKVGYAKSTISKAENFHAGDGMVGVRITIIETMTGETVEGPFYQ